MGFLALGETYKKAKRTTPGLERETGFEPATHCLGSNCATTAPLPHCLVSIRENSGTVNGNFCKTVPSGSRGVAVHAASCSPKTRCDTSSQR